MGAKITVKSQLIEILGNGRVLINLIFWLTEPQIENSVFLLILVKMFLKRLGPLYLHNYKPRTGCN